jgi:cytochrome d ubiquinol oxidase subunit II
MSSLDATALTNFWVVVIAASILIYVVLDGFDLGVGILFGFAGDENQRDEMMTSIAPFWDGNETWLVVIGASLFAAFPAVYTVFLGAFYLPVLAMLLGLVFRGIAFEFRERSDRMRPVWDRGFFIGSLVVAFVQGAAVGAMMRGIPVENGQFAGSSFGWLHPFSVLTGLGLVVGYALLGACWLLLKGRGTLRDWAADRIVWLGLGMFAILVPALVVAWTVDVSDGLRQAGARFGTGSLVSSAIAFYALLGVIAAGHGPRDWLPFLLAVVFFVASFATLATLMWPYMIPYALTAADAAAPEASLRFFFYAGVIALPMIAAYTIGVYWVFRGKNHR